MTRCISNTTRAAATAFLAVASLAAGLSGAAGRVHHRHHATAAARQQDVAQQVPQQAPQQQGVAGYFGPGAYGPLGLFGPGYGYGYGYGPPRGDLGFALLGALNGGGFRGFVECGNYYARYPGACGF